VLHFQLIPQYKSNDSFYIIYIRAGYNYKRSHLIGVFMMRMKYCPHLPAFIDQLRTGVINVVSHAFPWIAVVSRHVLSWVFSGSDFIEDPLSGIVVKFLHLKNWTFIPS